MSCSGPVNNEANQSSNVPIQDQEQPQETSVTGEPSPAVPAQESNQTAAGQDETQVMLNPPHGEPYHRCDIPVGSPLPGVAPVASSNQPRAEQVEPKVMLNPPHGEPFHRCDIPVGSPLPANSPQQATTNQAAAPAPAASSAPATVDRSMIPTVENSNRLNTSAGRQSTTASSTPSSGTPPKNNPPHGQPWHRCDIPVGSPLPVK
ncbi:MAG: hypothetical protein ABR597_14455 [Bacteroidales bacterium]